MKRRFLCVMLLAYSSVGLNRAQDSPPSPPPVSKVDIFGRLAAGASRSYVAHLVKMRGIDFSPDDDFFAAIERAGGEGVLLDRLRVVPDGDGDTSTGISGDRLEHLAECAELQTEGDFAKAETECRAAMSSDPKNAFAVLGTVQCLKLQNNLTDVSRLIQQAVELGPDLAESHYALATSMGVPNSFEEMKEAKRLEPDELDFRPQFDAWLKDPELSFSGQLTDDEVLQDSWKNAEKECRDRLELEADFAPAHADLAEALRQEGKGEEALEEMAEAVRLEPGVGDLRVTMAMLASLFNREDLSVEARREAVRVAPANRDYRDALAMTLYQVGDADGARREYGECLSLDAGNYDCHRGLENLLENQRDLDGAAAEYRRELAIHPGFTQERLELARVLQSKGDLKGAFAECEEILRSGDRDTDPSRAMFFDAEAHHRIGYVLLAQGSAEDAVGQFRIAIAAVPAFKWFRYGLGEALDKAGASDQAEREFRDLLREDPENAAANNEMAWFYATAKDLRYRNPKAALELAKKAVAASGGGWPNILDTLAEAYYVNHRLAEALTTEKKAIELDPKNVDLQAQLRKFQIAALSPAISMLRVLR
jgi:tetratricopeptide (TPR) repeat protein